MNHTLRLVFFFVIYAVTCHAQTVEYTNLQENIDSLFNNHSSSQVIQFINTQSTNDINSNYLLHLSKVKAYLKTKQYDSIPKYIEKVQISNAKDSTLKYLKARKLELQGHYFYKTNKLVKCISKLEASSKLYDDNNNIEEACYNNIMMGIVYRLESEYVKSLSKYYKSLEYYLYGIEDSVNFITASNDIAIVYIKLGYYNKAESSLKELLNYTRHLSQKNKANIYNNLAIIYGQENKNELALKYLLKAEKIYFETKNQIKLAVVYNNLATIHYQLYNDEKTSLDYYYKSYIIKKTLNDYKGQIETTNNLGKLYYQINDYTNAQKYCELSLNLAIKYDEKDNLVEAHRFLSLIYEKKENYKKAYEHHKEYKIVQDQIWNLDKEKQLIEVEKQNEFNAILTQLELVENKQALSNLESSNRKTIIIILSITFIFLLLALLAYIYMLKIKGRNKFNLYEKNIKIASMSSLIKGQEDERKRIAQDLHDGVGNSLALLNLNLENQTKEKLQLLVQTISQDIRNISQNLMPAGLTKFGLKKSLLELSLQWSSNNIVVDLNYSVNEDYFKDPLSALTIYRIIQESLRNAITKGDANYVSILFKEDENSFSLTIEDNGKGFNLNKSNKGSGLANMENRVAFLGGKLSIYSYKQGTSINISIPKLAKNPI